MLFKKSSQNKDKNDRFASFVGIKRISREMIWLPDNYFVAALKCDPVNYDLKNETEQEGIDISFERWLTSVDWDMCWYTQSRPVDLSAQYSLYQERILNLHENAKVYGQGMINYLQTWVQSQPRFETVRYVLFPFKITDKKDEHFTQKQMVEKARNELNRRIRMSQVSLERCGITAVPCNTMDLLDMVYFAVNRKRAGIAKLKDVEEFEMLSSYVTADDKVYIKPEREGHRVQITPEKEE